MAQKMWTLTLDGADHSVRLEHSPISGKRVIRVDGKVVAEIGTKLVDFGSDHRFPVEGHNVAVHIRPAGLGFVYDLSVDGRSAETDRPVGELRAIPWWMWILYGVGYLYFCVTLGALGELMAWFRLDLMLVRTGVPYYDPVVIPIVVTMVVGTVTGVASLIAYRRGGSTALAVWVGLFFWSWSATVTTLWVNWVTRWFYWLEHGIPVAR